MKNKPPKVLNESRILPYALTLCALALVYQIGYSTYGATPGVNPSWPLGWWGWADQGLYLKSSVAMWQGDYSAEKHFYLPLYPFVGALLLWFTEQHSYWLPDLLLMLGFAGVSLVLMGRYVGAWIASGSLLAGMIAFEPLRTQWIIPWTSTLSAFLMIATLFLLDRYIRFRDGPSWTPREAGLNATIFGLTVGALVATRAIDVVVIAPAVIAYGVYLGRDMFNGKEGRRIACISMLAGVVGGLPPIVGWLVFNRAVYGAYFGGPYFGAADTIGFFPSTLPSKMFAHLVDSYPLYGEKGQDWLSQIPLFALAVTFVPALLITPVPLIFRIVAASAIVQFCLYYSYADIVPTGTFRYHNIHYFKWIFPVLLGGSICAVISAFSSDRPRGRRARLALLSVLAVIAVPVVVTMNPRAVSVATIEQRGNSLSVMMPEDPVDYLDLPGVWGDWDDIYFGRGFVASHNGTVLRQPRDYHPYPIAGGMRLVFVRPVSGGVLSLDLGGKALLSENFRGGVTAVDLAFGPSWSSAAGGRGDEYPPIEIGTELVFAAGGAAERYLGHGWSGGESWGRWIDGRDAEIRLKLEERPINDIFIKLVAGGFVAEPSHPTTATEVYVGECIIGRLNFRDGNPREHLLRVPSPCIADSGALRMRMKNITPVSPSEVGASTDTRKLGAGVISLRLEK